jgi:hypothetical protein
MSKFKLPDNDWTKQEPCKSCDGRIYCCDFNCPIEDMTPEQAKELWENLEEKRVKEEKMIKELTRK